ncbi:MAG: hypothetical protein ACR2H0_07785 [Candidatus Limnocylindrales bacterium]
MTDSAVSPSATCGYGPAEPPHDWAWLDWMKLRAPRVYAADRNAGVREQRRVSWQFKVQLKTWYTGTSGNSSCGVRSTEG